MKSFNKFLIEIQKRITEENLLEYDFDLVRKAKSLYPVTDNLEKTAFILYDGTLLSKPDGVEHQDIASKVLGSETASNTDLIRFMLMTGSIRFTERHLNATIICKPTTKQRDVLLLAIHTLANGKVTGPFYNFPNFTIELLDSTGESFKNKLFKTVAGTDEIHDFINDNKFQLV